MSSGYGSTQNGMQTIILPNGGEFITEMLYTPAQTHGVIVLVVISCLSLTAVIGLLLAIAISAYNTRHSLDEHLFVRTPVAGYFISLLLFDIVQAVGSIINAHWINLQSVQFGRLCVAQGAIKQAADVGAALWTLIIAAHTFAILFLQLTIPSFAYWGMLVFGWFAILTIIISGPAALDTAKRGSFWGISGYWCWISEAYQAERLSLDYLVMFLSAFLSFVLYMLVFLKLRGNVVVDGWRTRLKRRTSTAGWGAGSDDRMLSIARTMLLFPIAYTILILPIAAARFSSWSGITVPFQVTIFCGSIFLTSGLVNVILFTTARRILPPGSVFPNLRIFRRKAVQKTTIHVYSASASQVLRSSTTSSLDKVPDDDLTDDKSEFTTVPIESGRI